MTSSAIIPPQNLEAERALLGGVLLDPRTVTDLPAELKPESFYLPTHAKIFQIMLELWEHEAPIDVVSVTDKAKAAGHEITVSALIEIQDQGMPRSIAYHAGLVLAAFGQRRSFNILRDAYEETKAAPERSEEIISRLYSANDTAAPSGAMPIQTVMLESLKRIEHAQDYRAIIPTGLIELDRAIGGIERGELIIIAGRPSMGKTSLALDFGLNAAARGYSVFIISVETSREKLGMRMLSRESGNFAPPRCRTATIRALLLPAARLAACRFMSWTVRRTGETSSARSGAAGVAA